MGSTKARSSRSRSSSSSSSSKSSSRGRYAVDSVRRAFGGAITFSDGAASDVAAALNDLPDLGNLEPDAAARLVVDAVSRAVYGSSDDGKRELYGSSPRHGAAISIDTALAALTYMHAELNTAGEQVGGSDEPAPEPAPTGGGTAAAAGGTSSGPGTAADTGG